MDDYGIKSGPARETPAFAGTAANGPKSSGFVASLGGLAATFTDLFQKMGSRMSADRFNAPANAVPPLATEWVQEAAPKYRHDYRDDRGRDRIEFRDRYDEPRNERPDVGHSDRTDLRPSEDPEYDSKTAPTTRTDDRDSRTNESQSNSNDTAANDKPQDTNRHNSRDQNATAENSGSRLDESNEAGGNQAGADAIDAQQRAQQIIAGMTAREQGSAQTDQGAQEGKSPPGGSAQNDRLLKNMAAAAAIDGKGNATVKGRSHHTEQAAQEGKAQFGESTQSDRAVQNITAAAATDGKGNPAVKAGVHHVEQGPQSQIVAQKAAGNQNQANNGSEGDNRNTAANAFKVAELARLIGSDDRAQIQVAVKDVAATLVSKPAATLALTGIGAGKTAAQAQHGQKTAVGAAQQTAGQSTQQVSQQQTANQASQIQAAGGEAKGPTQAGGHTVQGSQATALTGGESQATAGTSQTSETAQAQKVQDAQATTAPQRPQVHNRGFVDQISVNITKALREGIDKINIQLRPATLGRIDVQLEVGHDGRISAVVTADNKDTLDMLQRDARGLEKALQDAGLQADAGSMSFNLRKQGDEGQEPSQSTVRGDAISNDDEDGGDRLEAILAAERNRGRGNANGRIDFWA